MTMALLMNLGFAGGNGAVVTPVSPATRYRLGHRIDWVTTLVLLWIGR